MKKLLAFVLAFLLACSLSFATSGSGRTAKAKTKNHQGRKEGHEEKVV
jgi:hypothetical protein